MDPFNYIASIRLIIVHFLRGQRYGNAITANIPPTLFNITSL